MNQGSVVIENNDIFFFIASTILSQLCTCFWAAVDGRSAKQKPRLFEISHERNYISIGICRFPSLHSCKSSPFKRGDRRSYLLFLIYDVLFTV